MFFIAIYVTCILVIVKILLKSGFEFYNGPECLAGKVAIITGGNRGIGFEVAKCLAARGCRIIIACRSKAENEKKQLIELTHNPNITVKQLDLKSYESVRNFSKEIHKTEDKIDILINNAGISVDLGSTPDGFHPVMQTNVFSPFLLTCLLVDLLKKSDDGRVVFTSSVLAFNNNLTVENLNPSASNDKSMDYYFKIYGNTKLAEIIISNYIAEKLKKYGVKSNAVHPGFINTGIWGGLEFQASPAVYEIITKWILYLTVFFYSRTPKEGAQGIVAVAVSDKYKETTGQFFWGFGMANVYPNPRSLRNKAYCDEIYRKIEAFAKLNKEELL